MQKPSLHKSFLYAFRGIFQMAISERNFQIEACALIVNVILIFYFKLNTLDVVLILFACFIILSAEIFNTAIEKICDMIQPEYDERIKFIKDISAGAVTLLCFVAIVVGILVYWKYVF